MKCNAFRDKSLNSEDKKRISSESPKKVKEFTRKFTK